VLKCLSMDSNFLGLLQKNVYFNALRVVYARILAHRHTMDSPSILKTFDGILNVEARFFFSTGARNSLLNGIFPMGFIPLGRLILAYFVQSKFSQKSSA